MFARLRHAEHHAALASLGCSFHHREFDMAQSTLERHRDYVHAIGVISIENANLEVALAELFARILHISPQVGEAIYLTPRSAFARLEIFRAAADAALRPRRRGGQNEARKAETLIKAHDLHRRAKSAVGRRHDVIHNAWGTTAEEPEKVARTTLPRPQPGKGKPAPLSGLHNLLRPGSLS
jgi:hypothetical protein